MNELEKARKEVMEFGKGDLKPKVLKYDLNEKDEESLLNFISMHGFRPDSQTIEDRTLRLDYNYDRVPWMMPSGLKATITSTFILNDPHVALISFHHSNTLGNVIRVVGFSAFDSNYPDDILGAIFKEPEYTYTIDVNPHDKEEPFDQKLTWLPSTLRPKREVDLGIDKVWMRSFRFNKLKIKNNKSARVFEL